MFLIKLALFASIHSAQAVSSIENSVPNNQLLGVWRGIDLFQDESSYDGKTFYLPNNKFLLIDQHRIRIYYYPYSKIDEFEMKYTDNKLKYKLESGITESYYSISNDTLRLEMHFINKVFVKVYIRSEVDDSIVEELDKYGFNPSSIKNEFEIDTFHIDQRIGFTSYDSLNFKPYTHLQFMADDKIKINRGEAVHFIRGYQTIRFTYEGVEYMFTVNHSEGTQRIFIVPSSICRCNNIVLPYMTSSWGDRIREAIKEDLEWD